MPSIMLQAAAAEKWAMVRYSEITPEGWSKTLELNLTSLMYSNQSAVKVY